MIHLSQEFITLGIEMYDKIDGWRDGWVGGWVDEWIGGWMNGWADE